MMSGGPCSNTYVPMPTSAGQKPNSPPAPFAPLPTSVAAVDMDPLQPLILLQAFDGCWALEPPLASALGVNLSDLKTNLMTLPEPVWATALSVAFLQLRMLNRE